jgi:alanine dehydrogenase
MTRAVDAQRPITFGFPRMRKEGGERRDFLPGTVRAIARLGCPVVVESGLGAGMSYADGDYEAGSTLVEIADARTAFAQDVVITLRSPDDMLERLRPGATLVSMLHFPTRPGRIARLDALGLEAISLDCIEDDDGRRLVENMRAVGWNGMEAAFDALARIHPQLTDPGRAPIRVTVMGAGAVARHAVEAATKYGSPERNREYAQAGLPGVIVTVLGRNMTCLGLEVRRLLRHTDVLVDATQRSDPSKPLIPNRWLASLPEHAVICDLVVDPYQLETDPPTVRGIEGIPQGDLDQWTFLPDDPAWTQRVPSGIPNRCRRAVVSCYSWPGIHPEECMQRYERQLVPLLTTLVEREGVAGLSPDLGMIDRALLRASLRTWTPGGRRPLLTAGLDGPPSVGMPVAG